MYLFISRALYFRTAVLCLLLFCAAGKGYGQTKVYATNYGYLQSGPGLLGLLSAGLVNNPIQAIEPNSTNGNYTQLTIGGLLGDAYAIYQLEYNNNGENLPAGTSIYVRLDDNTTDGLLGLLLASQGFVSAYKDANSNNTISLTGNQVTLNDSEVIPVIISNEQYLKITPSQCFNALRFSITSKGLLGLLTTGNVRIYRAYYECPSITIEPPSPICEDESITLEILNSLNTDCGQKYLWYNVASGGSPLNTDNGTSFNTGPLEASKTYWVEYTGVDVSQCGRTSVTVTVHPKPGIPEIDAN